MSHLANLQELQLYLDLLPDLQEHRAAHQAVLRALPAHCLRCLEALAQQQLCTASTQALASSRQLCQQAAHEAAQDPTRWHRLRSYLHEALQVWQLISR